MLVLITGGVRSGKSFFAEKLAHAMSDNKTYIATAVPYDEEMKNRILHHKNSRKDSGFVTIEQPYNIEEAVKNIDEKSTVLLECLGTLITNELLKQKKDTSDNDIYKKIYDGIFKINEKVQNLIVVSNEVFSEGKEYDEITEKFLDIMAKTHYGIAKHADIIVECVYGLTVIIKGENLLNEVLV